MLTWILGYFWSLPRGVSPRLEWGHARALSSRAVSAVSSFPSRGSMDLWLSIEAFPQGFPTELSHVPPWCESILGLKVEAVQGKQVSLECTETSGCSGNGSTTLEFLSPFLWRAPPLEIRRKPGILSRPRRGRFPLLDLAGGNGALLDVGGTLVLPLEWRRVCRELLELQQGCEEPFGSSRGLGVISLESPQRKWASSRLEGRTSWIFSSWDR